jgi:hypothetical protein
MHLLLQPPHAKRARERNAAAAAHGVGRHFSARERVPVSTVRPIMLPAREMVPDQGSQSRSSSWLGGGARWLHFYGLFLAHLNEGREGDQNCAYRSFGRVLLAVSCWAEGGGAGQHAAALRGTVCSSAPTRTRYRPITGRTVGHFANRFILTEY